MRMSEGVGVFGRAEGVERLSRIALGEIALALFEKQSGLRPVETGARVGVCHRAAVNKRSRYDAFSRREVSVVGERVAQQTGEADVLDRIEFVVEMLDAPLEEGDGGRQLAERRVHPPEGFGEPWPIERLVASRAESFGQVLDGLSGVAGSAGDVTQPLECLGAKRV